MDLSARLTRVRAEAAFKAAVERYRKEGIPLRNRALIMEEHKPLTVTATNAVIRTSGESSAFPDSNPQADNSHSK